MNFGRIFIALAALVALTLLNSSLYTVGEQEQVIITQFGRPVGAPVTEAGLHFKTPFVQDVNRFDKRILQWDGPPAEMTTKDKLFIVVDSFARWQITDPLLYLQSVRDERTAQSRLDSVIGSEVRNVVARHDLIEVVRTDKARKPVQDEATVAAKLAELPPIQFGRERLEKEILETAIKEPVMKELGIRLLDFRIKRINYKASVLEKIYGRMVSERDQIAQSYLSAGEGEAAKIMGRKEKELQQIQSDAYKRVQEIQGRADAEATQIYAQAYNTSPAAADFFQFLKTLETYQATLGRDATMILTTDSDLFRYLKRIDGRLPPAPRAPTAQP